MYVQAEAKPLPSKKRKFEKPKILAKRAGLGKF